MHAGLGQAMTSRLATTPFPRGAFSRLRAGCWSHGSLPTRAPLSACNASARPIAPRSKSRVGQARSRRRQGHKRRVP